ncbi:MAG: exonuclease domain-containing protein [Acetatifactor sp.]
MNYVVFDLEWNQGNQVQQTEHADIPFEVIEIGAVKLNDKYVMISEFSRLIKPEVYREMHQYTSKLIHLQMEELERGRPFAEVMKDFLEWCGTEEYLFCSWGSLDLTELQRNMRYHNMTPLSDRPIPYLDVQKLFSLVYEDGKSRRSLETAVDMVQLEKDIPFHRAFSDAYYTAKLLTGIAEQKPEVLRRISFDTFHPPKTRAEEVKVQFDTYVKYISREFDSKAEAFADREVSSSKCYLCHKNLRKKIRWFSPNSKHYYCLARCDKHGYLKGKLRIHKSESGKLFAVKITKLITEEEAERLKERCDNAKKMQKYKNSAN